MNLNKQLVVGLLLLIVSVAVKAQIDPHFSQYYSNPLWLNPALTGTFDGEYRVTANYRSQWHNIENPYSTVGLTGEFVTDKNLNIGVNLLQQSAGGAGYNYTTGYGTFNYTGIKWGAQGLQRLTMGMQLGAMNRRFDPSKFKLGDQWNPITGYNPGTSTESFAMTSKTVFDASAGLFYFDATPGRKANVFAGASAFHLTRPEDPFGNGEKVRMPVRYTAHAGVKLTLTEEVNITPNVLYLQQGNNSVKMLGVYAALKADTYTDILAGANYRLNDAVVAFAGVHFNNLLIGISYDANNSSLRQRVSSSNAVEISVSFTGRKTKLADKENFICPRL